MCGIAGFVDRADRVADPEAALRAMAAHVAHRGPDGEGSWREPRLGVAIVHRRLAILDRTPAAAQPFVSRSGRWVLAFNGEVWNFRELRAELEAARADVGPSTGDTAVLAALLEARGAEAAVAALDGMFAFVALDVHERVLWLARDRFGVKPLFWGHAEDGHGLPLFAFASELRAIAACPGFRNRVSPFALAAVLGSLAVRGPRTVWEGIQSVRPGHLVRLELSTGRVGHVRWFDLRDAAARARRDPFAGTRDDLAVAFDGLLDAAVTRRLVSDVPVGALLSGGIDSSLVVASWARSGRAPLPTFTAGFDDARHDERAHARAVAAALGTEHHEVEVGGAGLVGLAEDAIGCFDEPFADSSAVAALAVCRAARARVGVVLSGEGGDEFFGGYERHLRGFAASRWLRTVPPFARRRMASAIGFLGADAWERLLAPLGPALPGGLRRPQRGRLVRKLASILESRDDEELWRSWFAVWPQPASLLAQLPSDLWASTVAREARAMPGAFPGDADGFMDEMLLRDQSIYLPDDLLVKLDRCSMESGLEAREPLLDMRLFELAWRIPPAWRTDGTVGKVLLRDSLRRRLPARAAAVAGRPKQGFGVPLRAWLCGPLASWADGILDPRRIDAQGVLLGGPVHDALVRARAGDDLAAHQAWAACVVSRWCEREGIDAGRVARP